VDYQYVSNYFLKRFKLFLIVIYLQAAETTAKFCKIVNKVAIPVALFIDIIQTGLAVREDYKKGTTRNTVETVAGKGGGWLGGYGGIVFFYPYKTRMFILNCLT
jgi:hypothetical protein